ncbi:unnamed protein product [Protopolystoma xenopodis]|uniref:Uncharacterized protein n=1 Tax=Protopolystoma xenopodis TaxID=117903 RepID=A0A3S5BE94_9PLAT|nr:unnamed protein product [Protopolystoma xenopodis]
MTFQALRDSTVTELGPLYVVSWVSCGCCFLASWCLLLAAVIQRPPTVLPPSKNKQTPLLSTGNDFSLEPFNQYSSKT